jgi:hypothetical protein
MPDPRSGPSQRLARAEMHATSEAAPHRSLRPADAARIQQRASAAYERERANAACERDGAPAHGPRLGRQRRAFKEPRDFAHHARVASRQLKSQRVTDAQLDRLRRDGQRRRGHRLRSKGAWRKVTC